MTSNDLLQDRARMLSQVRSFFERRAVLEVDCFSLIRSPSLDAHIDAISLEMANETIGYLHTSPEYLMKRLLSQGLGDMYYLGHVYRKGDIGRYHHPEFTMIEWYRREVSYFSFIQEVCELIALFLGPLPIRPLSYREAFLTYADMDPFEQIPFAQTVKRLGLPLPSRSDEWDSDTQLHFILSHAIEPQLGKGELTVLTEYPPSQAALARLVKKEDRLVAERFEIYCEGIELSNGYHELSDAVEQRRRFIEENRARASRGQEPYPLDEAFLQALELGLPDCCGVSVGFDRLMILRHQCHSIREVIPSPWEASLL